MLKYNMYALFAILTVFIVAIGDINIGPMYKEEMRARREGKLLADGVQPLVPEKKADFPDGYEPTISAFVLPMVALFVSLFGVIFYTGDIGSNGVLGAFRNANITVAIMIAFVMTGVVAGIVGCVKGTLETYQRVPDIHRRYDRTDQRSFHTGMRMVAGKRSFGYEHRKLHGRSS